MMPLFEYECRKCGHQFEALVVASRTPTCPKCKSQDLEKRVSSLGFAGVGAWSGGRSSSGCGSGGGGG
jgi:putative FmdB family regulatory protein